MRAIDVVAEDEYVFRHFQIGFYKEFLMGKYRKRDDDKKAIKTEQ